MVGKSGMWEISDCRLDAFREHSQNEFLSCWDGWFKQRNDSQAHPALEMATRLFVDTAAC